ncbi:glycosyltransferase, partial [Candidatus Kaiserbacteria bacterium]|nr:glycosyltransferase [Candidatus Kaiserbacteria bacterium]
MLSTDRTIFEKGSPARMRMEEYAQTFGTLSVIVFSRGVGARPTVGAPLSIYPTGSASRFAYIRDAVKIGAHIQHADVVTAQDPFETGLAGVRIARRLKLPLHVQVHTDFMAPGFTFAHWPLNMIRRCIASLVLPKADRIRTVSARIKEKLEKRYHPKGGVSVLPIFVDTEKFAHVAKTSHPKFKTVLLVVSRLEKEKRIDRTVDALKKVRDAGIDAGLVIVGSGSEEKPLKRLVRKVGASEWVEFAGFQNNLIPYYASAQVLLYPGAPYEGYGMSIIEALAAGVPVLALDVGIARQAG